MPRRWGLWLCLALLSVLGGCCSESVLIKDHSYDEVWEAASQVVNKLSRFPALVNEDKEHGVIRGKEKEELNANFVMGWQSVPLYYEWVTVTLCREGVDVRVTARAENNLLRSCGENAFSVLCCPCGRIPWPSYSNSRSREWLDFIVQRVEYNRQQREKKQPQPPPAH